jgi:hypothetical protein
LLLLLWSYHLLKLIRSVNFLGSPKFGRWSRRSRQ